MLRLTGYGVRNLRALSDTGVVDLKPITILVGKNSAGKSTFARVLPLLKQSAERRKKAPLLWYGRLVDFGSFAEAVSSLSEEREIELLLRFSSPPAHYVGRRNSPTGDTDNTSETSHIDVVMTVGSDGDDSRTVLRSLKLDVYGVKVRVDVESTREIQLQIGGRASSTPDDARLALGEGAILPLLRLVYKAQLPNATVRDAALFEPPPRAKLGATQVRSAISLFVHGNTLEERKDEIAERLPLASLSVLLKKCQELSGAPDTWRSSFNSVSPDSAKLSTLQRSLVLYKLDSLLLELDQATQYFCDGISYLEPLRATAQRYYRREEVSTDELDPKGLNTTFFIQGLSARERESLNEWLNETFGFTLTVKTAGGHSTLNIATGDGAESRNMADVGLGYSQLTPVAIQLWAATRRLQSRAATSRTRFGFTPIRTRDMRAVVVVEQPELHLHPAYQAKLADVLALCVNRGEGDSANRIELIAETHSPNLINRLGELIGEGRLSPEDVQILVFEANERNPNSTKVRRATFDGDGVLQNWPIGFFDY